MTEKDSLKKQEKQNKLVENKYVKIGTTAFLTIVGSILFYFAIDRIDKIMSVVDTILKSAEPIIIGCVLAYIFMPVKNMIEKAVHKMLSKIGIHEEKSRKHAKTIAIFGSVIALFVIIALLIAIIVPAVTSSAKGLIEATPKYVASFLAWIDEMGIKESSIVLLLVEYIADLTNQLQQWATEELVPLLQQYIGQITSGVYTVLKSLLNFIIGIIVMVYVMAMKETFVGQSKKIIYAIFPVQKGNLIVNVFRKTNKIFGGFIIGKIIDSAIIGVLCYIGCLLLRIPSPVLVAVIVGVTNVIPFFGPFIGAIPSILLVLIQSPIHGLYLAIFILILQQVDGNIIGPKILGDTTGLSSFWVLFAILVSGGLFGFIGMLIGVPMFAVIYYICQQLVAYQMDKRSLSNSTDDYVELESIDVVNRTMIYKEALEESKAQEE